MKLYTGTGDRGKTSLFSGERVLKSHLRIEAYGDLDELNSIVGALIASLPVQYSQVIEELQQVQSDLFTISALLATSSDSPSMDAIEEITPVQIERLESTIDRMQEELPKLHGFILPGGHISASWSHLARTVCRRSERRTVRLLEEIFPTRIPNSYQQALTYVNRLSDYFFALARYCNYITGVPEKLWKK